MQNAFECAISFNMVLLPGDFNTACFEQHVILPQVLFGSENHVFTCPQYSATLMAIDRLVAADGKARLSV